MAESGTIQGRVFRNSSKYAFRASWWESDVDTANNTSVLHCVVYLDVYRYKFSTSYGSYGLELGGTEVASGSNVQMTYGDNSSNPATYAVIADQTKLIQHADDGSATVTISALLGTGSGSYAPGNCELRADVVLTKIARNSTFGAIGALNFTGEYDSEEHIVIPTNPSVTINIIRPNANATHTLTAEIDGVAATLISVEDITGTSYTLNFPTDKTTAWLNSTTTSKSGVAKFTLTTYLNEEQIGSIVTKTSTYTINTSVFRPYRRQTGLTINQWDDITDGTALEGKKIHLQSQSRVTVGHYNFNGLNLSVIYNPENTCGGAIFSYYELVWDNGAKALGTATSEHTPYGDADKYTLEPSPMSGKRILRMTVYDTRGASDTFDLRTLVYQPYTQPTLSAVEADRAVLVDDSPTKDEEGTDMLLDYSVSSSPLYKVDNNDDLDTSQDLNQTNVQYRLAEDVAPPQIPSWSDWANVPAGKFVAGEPGETLLNAESRYLVQLSVTDAVGGNTVQQTYISATFFTMHFKAGGKAVGLLRSASGLSDGEVGIDGDLLIGNNDTSRKLKLNGVEMVDFVKEDGVDNNGWSYRKWNSGIAECWKVVARSSVTFPAAGANNSAAYTSGATIDLPNGLFVANTVPVCSLNIIGDSNGVQTVAIKSISNTQIDFWYMSFYGINNTHTYNLGISVCAVGRWK